MSRRCAVAALLAALAGCEAAPWIEDDQRLLPKWRRLLRVEAKVRAQTLDEQLTLPALGSESAVVVVDPNWRVPGVLSTDQQRAAMRGFLESGGRLVLFGHAAKLVGELGLEPERPENTVYRWGFDRRSVRGDAELRLEFGSQRLSYLREGLRASDSALSIAVAGGRPYTAPLCAWQQGAPTRGEVLAKLGAVCDGAAAPPGPPVLLRWKLGSGEVLACGVLPAVDAAAEHVRSNARGFVRRCARWAGAGSRRVVLLAVPPRSAALPPSFDGLPPMTSLLAHWGWQTSPYGSAADVDPRSVDEVVREALAPSYRQGADVLELTVADAPRGAALALGDDDPIQRPASWRARSDAWGDGQHRAMAREAHARGLLLFGGLDSLPVDDDAAERAVALRLHARERAGVRRDKLGAFDGFGLREWWHDPRGVAVTMVQDYHPGAAVYIAGERAPAMGAGLRAFDADDGGVAGWDLAGVSSDWRNGFAPDLFPVGVLDARAVADSRSGLGVRGGGSYADWLVEQFSAFVRPRRLTGGTALWRRLDPETTAPSTRAYVQGLSMEPLRAAVAAPLAATGRDGLRAAVAALLPQQAPGFAEGVDAPAAVHVIQNNWLRLLGSGGALQFDPRGLADFRSGSVTLSPGWLRTRLRGARGAAAAADDAEVDWLRFERRGEGAYEDVHLIVEQGASDQRFPAKLARAAAPAWPRAVAFEWEPEPGAYELEVQIRAARAAAVVTIWLDDVMLRALPCATADAPPVAVVPVHVARGGVRSLRVEVFDGDLVEVERLRMRRVGAVGVEAEVSVPAGSFAQLVERSASEHHEERVVLSMLADVPGFVVNSRCVRAVRGLRTERRIDLPSYVRLRAASSADRPDDRRGPFVLGSEVKGAPDICVVPLSMPRYERLEFEPGVLAWRGVPAAGRVARVGFLLCPKGDGVLLMPHLRRLLDSIDRPLSVALGGDGRAALASDLPVPHSRLLHVDTAAVQPLLVRERGFWTWRPAQPAPGGGVWLRVHQAPEDVVQVVGGAAVFSMARPGTGAMRCVALRDVRDGEVTAVVTQRSRLCAPSVVMPTDFDEVSVNGAPWSYYDGRSVFLPDAPGAYRVQVHRSGSPQPHVRVTRAPLERCHFDPATRELTLETRAAAARPPGLPWTAVLSGPPPVAIVNGELVDDRELDLRGPAAAAAARAGGVLIRFLPGVTTVRYDGASAR